jgi:hypothetical protein
MCWIDVLNALPFRSHEYIYNLVNEARRYAVSFADDEAGGRLQDVEETCRVVLDGFSKLFK